MISYRKFGTFTYHTLSKAMISHDWRVAVFPNSFSFLSFLFFFFFSWAFSPSLSFVLTLDEVNCGITRDPLAPKDFFYIFLTNK